VEWKKLPHPSKAFIYDGVALKKHWHRLHRGDREPFPDAGALEKLVDAHPALEPPASIAEAAEAVQDAWRAFHRGDFQEAVETGLKAGLLGFNAANRASNIYATYLEADMPRKLEIFQEVIHRAEELQAKAPDLPNAWYFYAQALGRYAQGISIVKALAEGLGGKMKSGLDRAIKLAPEHADAHIALGAFHANIVNKLGVLAARLAFGASKEAALEHFQAAVRLNPHSAIAKIEYANGLAMLFGKSKLNEAARLYEEAAASVPADAMEFLDAELAKSEIAA
jgi:tetratricopeptide (TPR) repeat protein